MTKAAAIIGTGTMGPGMGAVLARVGIDVRLYDVDAKALEAARSRAEQAAGVLDKLEAPSAEGGGLAYVTDLAEATAGVELVIEAVPERLDVKQQVFAELEQHTAPTTILASNTSGIPITQVADVCEHPERVVGMHWSNPPHLIPMIEVIPGKRTDETTVDGISTIVRSFGYEPVVLRQEVPGFVENRVLYAIMRECLDLVERGVISAEDMDTCVRWGIGYKLAVVGPMELLDMAGLDIYENVASYLNKDLCDRDDVSSAITELAAAGKLGMKTGQGIYDYPEGTVAEKSAARARKLVATRRALSAEPTT